MQNPFHPFPSHKQVISSVLPVNFFNLSPFIIILHIFFITRSSHVHSEPLSFAKSHEDYISEYYYYYYIYLVLHIFMNIIQYHYLLQNFTSLVTTCLGQIRYLPSEELQVSLPHIELSSFFFSEFLL